MAECIKCGMDHETYLRQDRQLRKERRIAIGSPIGADPFPGCNLGSDLRTKSHPLDHVMEGMANPRGFIAELRGQTAAGGERLMWLVVGRLFSSMAEIIDHIRIRDGRAAWYDTRQKRHR